MAKVTITPLGRQATLDALTAAVGQRFAALQDQLNAPGGAASADLAMAGYRITNLSNPAAPRDAINKQYLEQRLAEIELTAGAQGSSTSTTTVVTTLGIQISY